MSQPQRGCVSEPKVAVLGLGTRRARANPNGVASQSPRLLYSALGHGVPGPTPTGLRLRAQGCCTRPWDTACQGQPQRCCVSEPKVAVLGYLGTRRASPNPNGVSSRTAKLRDLVRNR